MGHDIKSIRQKFKEQGVFYTDVKLAEILKGYMPADLTEVYDPTCGSGNLLSVFGDTVRKYGQELDEGQAAEARQNLINSEIATGDTLLAPAFMEKRFKGIVANYPFSIKWDSERCAADSRFEKLPTLPPPSRADYAFIAHILHMLTEDGVAAVLGFPGILYRGQREGQIRKWLLTQGYIHEVGHFPGGFFVDTKIPVCLLVIRKTANHTGILMRDFERDIERLVPMAEIEANGYTLSVQTYVQPPEPEKPAFDPLAAELRARSATLRQIKAQIDFSLMVAKFEGWTIAPFLEDIINLANSYKQKQ